MAGKMAKKKNTNTNINASVIASASKGRPSRKATKEVPYIISTVTTRKIPSLYNDIGTIREDQCKKFFLDSIVEFMESAGDLDCYDCAEDVGGFFENFYDREDFCLDAEPWSAYAFLNNEWTSMRPSDEEIYAAILLIKN